MRDYVRQRPSPTISLSSLSYQFVRLLALFFMFFNTFSYCLDEFTTPQVDRYSLQKLFQLRSTQIINSEHKKFLRIIYFRDFDMTINEHRLLYDVRNLTEQHGIDLKVDIINQSKSYTITKICSLISQERRDTVIIADLYTKEIDLISRSLKIPTIAITNRYQIVHGKLHNPYLFKLMPDAVEEAKTLALAIDTHSVYTRIAVIYDVSLDMVEFRLSYLRLAKQHIVYRAQLPRISINYEFRRSARTVINDLLRIQVDLILCIMSTERETQFVRLIKEIGSPTVSQILLNRTSWWFASRLDEAHVSNYFPKIFTASEDRRRTLSQFSSLTVNILLNSILKTYIRLPNASIISSIIGPSTCDMRWNAHQLRKTHMFIKLFTNFTEWNCDTRLGSGVDPLLFEPKTLVWRFPTMFMVHTEHICQGMLTRTFYTGSTNADQIFRSCRQANYVSRKSSSSSQQDNSTSGSTTLVDINSFHRKYGKLWNELISECRFVQIDAPSAKLIVVGVVEPPYIFVSDAQISSEFHCNYGIPCYKVDPPLSNMSMDALFFQSKTVSPPHCCYGISVNLFLRMEDSNSVSSLKSTKLFVFADKPNKWVALIKALENRRAHLSISAIPYESSLVRGIDLSQPFYHSSYVIFTAPMESRSPLGVFLQPFSWTTWFMIFLVLNAAALFETFFEWHSPYGLTPKGRRRQKVFSLASALTLTWSIVFSHTFKTKSPKCWSNRFLGNVWGGFGIFFIAIYTAKLAAFMVEIAETQTATNVQGIVDACRKTSQCSIGVVANTSDEEYIRRFFTNTLYTHMRYVPSYAKGIDLLRTRAITYLLMDHSMARYYLTREVFKSIRISGDNFGSFGLSLGFSKFDAELKTNINNILLSYVDKGIIQRLHDDWYIYENCEIKRLNDNQKLSVDRFIGVFILLGTGMILGFVTLILEWVTFKFAVPYGRKRQWTGWMFASQRLYASLNASDEVFTEAYRTINLRSSRCVGERLHNYSTRSDSLDLRVVDVPKLICTTYQLKEQMNKINEQQQQQQEQQQEQQQQQQQNEPLQQQQEQLSSSLPPNGRLYYTSTKEGLKERRRLILTRINELEQELNHLKSRLSTSDSS